MGPVSYTHLDVYKRQIDTFEARSSVTPTTAQLIQQQAQNGVQGAYQATSVLAREGRMMMEAKIDQDIIPQLARQQTAEGPLNVNIDFLPSAAPDLSWDCLLYTSRPARTCG